MRTVRREPRIELGEWLGPQVVDASLRIDANVDQAGVAQHAQVPGDSGLMHAGEANEFAHGTVVFADVVEDATARRFGDHVEHVEAGWHTYEYTGVHIYVKSYSKIGRWQ